MKIFIALILGLVSSVAGAAAVQVSWSYPTAYVDGTPVMPGDITSVSVWYGTCNGDYMGTTLDSYTDPTATATLVQFDVPPGTYCFQMQGVANGFNSGLSSVIHYTVKPTTPNAPTQLLQL